MPFFASNIVVKKSQKKVLFFFMCICISMTAAAQKTPSLPAYSAKYSPSLIHKKIKDEEVLKFIITAKVLDSLYAVLPKDNASIKIILKNEASGSILAQCSFGFIKKVILPLAIVLFVDEYIAPQTEVNIIGYDRSFNGINQLDYLLPNANGKNIITGIKENNVEAGDIDLLKRVKLSGLSSSKTDNHATVIASIIGGAGNSFYNGRGQANACNFYPSSFANLFADDATILNQNGVSIQNHSYGTIPQQFYGAEAVSYDAATWQNKNILHVFSAGNRGFAAATEGKYANLAGFANITGNFKMAKNIITVAAIDNAGNIAAESSAGPLFDGRLAPQLTALGPNGTSDAAAIVTGTIAVLQQVYKDSNAQALPPASLVKALLYSTADDIGKPGIDYKTGYGLVNGFKAIKNFQQKNYDTGSINQNGQWQKNIFVPAAAAQFKIALSWTDTTAAINNTKALINDLDMEVKEITSGIVYKPWGLNTIANGDSLQTLPVRKRDSLNTAEMISIALPQAGTYEIKVKGTLITTPAIAFSVAYSTDTLNTFAFTNPQHTSDINIAEAENLVIKWKTFVADTNTTGNLFISYNRGNTWQLIKATHKIHTNKYIWPIKDTSSTGIFKMETAFGNFLSKEFILSHVTSPVADFVCTDSFRISWKKHVYANSYKIYTLTDSAYLKPIKNTTDTFIVFERNINLTLIYAVEPILANNIPAARSLAINILQQGVKCFYKTFFYELQDGNRVVLNAELSGTDYIDNISFEEVTQQGILLQTYSTQNVIAGNDIYAQITPILKEGNTYFRVKIKLKTGAVVYTDIITVLTSGKRAVRFYPNPVAKNSSVNLVVQQGVSINSKIQFFDVTGRLLRSFNFIPSTISMAAFPSGVIIYKLFIADNSLLETGKLLVN